MFFSNELILGGSSCARDSENTICTFDFVDAFDI